MPVKPVIGAAEIAAGFPKPEEPPNERSRFNDDKGAEGLNLIHFKIFANNYESCQVFISVRFQTDNVEIKL